MEMTTVAKGAGEQRVDPADWRAVIAVVDGPQIIVGGPGTGKTEFLVRRAAELLEHFGLGQRLDHRPGQLSGGEQQRVAIARALANNPPILMADEPTGNLNTDAGQQVIDSLKQVRDDFGTTVVLVTHDSVLAGQADRTLTLVDGQLVA